MWWCAVELGFPAPEETPKVFRRRLLVCVYPSSPLKQKVYFPVYHFYLKAENQSKLLLLEPVWICTQRNKSVLIQQHCPRVERLILCLNHLQRRGPELVLLTEAYIFLKEAQAHIC